MKVFVENITDMARLERRKQLDVPPANHSTISDEKTDPLVCQKCRNSLKSAEGLWLDFLNSPSAAVVRCRFRRRQ